jgi:Xaa-Pro aminopeptidase
MTAPILIHADSQRDADMFVATGIPVVDPFTYLELDGKGIVVISAVEADVARRDTIADDVWPSEQFGFRELMSEGWAWEDAGMEVVRRVLDKAGLQAVTVPPSFPLGLADYLRGKGITVTPDRGLFEHRRRIKDERQLAAIRLAQRATEASFRAARELIGSATPDNGGVLVAGGEAVTCERVRHTITETLREHGCEGESPLVGAGPQGARVHDVGSGPIHAGEPVIIDVFPRHSATRYCADMTRTFCYGEAPERLQAMHSAVLDALRRGTDAIRAGVPGRVPWEAACDAIEEGGFRTERGLADGERLEEDFFHGLGHGVGLEVHEAPGMGLGVEQVLEEGDVVTVEPGVYRKDFGGVRLEDLVVVTADGADVLTQFDYELEIRPSS